LGIQLLDHVVLGEERSFSFSELETCCSGAAMQETPATITATAQFFALRDDQIELNAITVYLKEGASDYPATRTGRPHPRVEEIPKHFPPLPRRPQSPRPLGWALR